MKHAIGTIRPEPRILCVDTDANSQKWMRHVLMRCRIASNVTVASTGRRAFNLLIGGHFDLCILDYALPDMSGVQLCSLVRHMGCSVPMMLFTAMARPIDRRRAFECGIDEYLSKPEDLGAFHVAVRRLLRRSEAPAYGQNAEITLFPRAA